MPVFEAKSLDGDGEGLVMLGALLHPTRAARLRARRLGRMQAERGGFLAKSATIPPRSRKTDDDRDAVVYPTA